MRHVAPCLALLALCASPAPAQETADTLGERGFDAAYNLDNDEAIRLFQQALAVDPGNAAAHRGIATALWLAMTSRRGAVCVDEFLDSARPRDVDLEPPDPELAGRFREHADRALHISRARVREQPADPDALYEYGASVGLLASYTATIEGRVLGAFRSARAAYDAHERVLALDPRRKDAGLIVGSYRYFVSTMSLPGRWVAYLVGFGGGREEGLRLIEEAARYPGGSQAEAKLALVLLYNRERRYDEAQRVLADLRRRLPRNRLLWFESGATALRGGALDVAETMLTEGLARFRSDPRPKAFGEEALWNYKLGTLRLGQRRLDAALHHLDAAARGEARAWVHARAHLGLGKLADLSGQRERARAEYEQAARLAQKGRDPATRDEAQRHLRRPFR